MKFMQDGSAAVAASATASDAPRRAAPWGLIGLAFAALSGALGTSIVNVALPSLASTFAAPFEAVQWLVIAYLLTSTAVVVAVGKLGDLFGARRLLLAGLTLFVVASIACALAPTLALLVAARALQGVGGAVLMATTVALARAVVAKERTGAAMGLLGTMSAIGTALGPSVGGALVTTLGWRAVFFANVPLVVVAFGLAVRHLPRDRERAAGSRDRFDAVGTALLAVALAAFALATTLRGAEGWRAGLAATALLSGVAFVAVERRAPSPLLPLAMLRERGLAGALLANTVVSTVMMATLVVGPFHLARALGLAPGEAGLVMSVGPLVSAVVGVPAGRLVDRIGARRVASLGLLGIVGGTAALAVFAGSSSVPAYAVPLSLTTAGYALFSAANNTAVMADATADRRGVLSSLLSLSRNLGLMSGATVLGAVFAVACGTSDVAQASPDGIAAATRTTFGLASFAVALVAATAMSRGKRRTRS